MFSTATKIYLLTNAIFIAAISFPSPGLGLFAAPFSLIFSAPLIFLLAACLWLLNKSKSSPLVCWILFLSAIALMTWLPIYWFDAVDELGLIPLAYASAFVSTGVLCKSIHQNFIHDHSIKSNVKREPWTS